ncbi:mechanosensitive ion channel protein 2, chloroplastic-like isoform X3 [Solanum pennellii]|uniref:Mechanosensitive ion channel protein 2, chloroplastic-like isoform X3 n=1 Tax=Solanum pennellii TaxID=28526 RepID=A0ABM1UYU3_SOLPN|nr:mechanosensitive ion channel protein 2, chloroplastic-like isoform X3 [Solanum pennellii]
MVAAGSLQLSHYWGTCKNHERLKKYSPIQRQDSWSIHHLRGLQVKKHVLPYRSNSLKCNSFLKPDQAFDISVKNAAIILKRSYNSLQGSPTLLKLLPGIGILTFAVWGLAPFLRRSRNILLHKSDNSWGKSGTYHVMTFYLQPLLLWTGAMLVCRALDPMVLPTEASQIVKQRLLNFVKSLSTVLASAYCLSSVIQQAQKFFMERSDANDTRNMGFQFAGRAIYTAVWVAAASLFMELLGFSTQKWLTAGGLGTVLLTLAGREIFTNFLSSIMIHATRPFVLNEWIQTKIEGYEVSGTVEHVGWWSPTIIRGEDREAIHIPNHKFTVNVVRNLTQKTHWRIKTHLAISHLDVSKINNIVADMRKVLAKNPQVEQQRLHRRVFLENVNPENQALLILISCFVKTSHFEEYLCVKEAILLDLLRVIRHHRARLATPIRTVQKIYSDADLDNMTYDSAFSRGAASTRPLLLIEPSYKVHGEDRTKGRPIRVNGEEDTKEKATMKPAPDSKVETKSRPASDPKIKETLPANSNGKDVPLSDLKLDPKVDKMAHAESKDNIKASSDPKSSKATVNKPVPKAELKSAEVGISDSKDPPENISSNKQVEKVSQGNGRTTNVVDNSATSPSDVREKTGNVPSTSQPKREDEKQQVSQPSVPSKPALEENIVLGVALEGSKRTLPIEEELSPPPNPAESKEMATSRSSSSNASTIAEKDKQDGQRSNRPNSTAPDQSSIDN